MRTILVVLGLITVPLSSFFYPAGTEEIHARLRGTPGGMTGVVVAAEGVGVAA